MTEIQKFTTRLVLSERDRRSAVAEGRDLVAETEARALAELVKAVHLAGYVGEGWPTVERCAFNRMEPCEPGEPVTFWHITVRVKARRA